jgi:hypothetical protein
MLSKPVELLSFQQGRAGLAVYLRQANALPLRDYVPLIEETVVAQLGRDCCRGHMVRAEPDDDINYSLLALLLPEDRGTDFDTADVARAWLRLLPAGATWTAERAAYRTLLCNMADEFVNGEDAGFDLAECSDNDCNEWIGAPIRADLYGWVCPGCPALAAEFARRDASLSHRGEGVHGAAGIAALGAAIGDAVTAGRDTDCNGATVGGLFGLTGKPVPDAWTAPWQGRIGLSLAGFTELHLDDVVARTVAVARTIGEQRDPH